MHLQTQTHHKIIMMPLPQLLQTTVSHHHHHRHHHHHHSIWYRIRRWVRHNKGLAAVGPVIVAAAVLAGGTYLHSSQQAQKKMHVTAGNSVDMKNGYRTRTYDGR